MRAVLAGLVVTFAGLSLACGLAGPTDATAPVEKQQRVYTRDEFKRLVVGKGPDEVQKAIGKPYTTRESTNSQLKYWHYSRVSKDPVTGKLDVDIQVVFRDGLVTGVNY